MDSKPLIAIDIDGVLADFNSAFLKTSKRVLGKPEKGFVVKDFDYTKCGWDEREVTRVWNHIRHTYNFWETLEAMPHTKQLMRLQNKFTPIFITSRVSTDGGDVATQTANWLERNFGIRDAYVKVTNEKGPIAKELGIEFFLDDKIENCTEVQKHAPGCKVFLQNATYNVHFNGRGIKRVESVNDFLGEVLDEKREAVGTPQRVDKKSPRADGRKKPRLRSKR